MSTLYRFPRAARSPSCGRQLKTRTEEAQGFSLLELLIVLAVLGVFSSIATYVYGGIILKAKIAMAIVDIKNIESRLADFYQENQYYPNTLEEIELGGLRDPWSNPYQYVNIATAPHQEWRRDRNTKPINTLFDLWSNGPDGDSQKQVNAAKSRDDIIRAWDGAFIGLGQAFDDLASQPDQDKGKGKKG
jgi:general secretion pathway protein G